MIALGIAAVVWPYLSNVAVNLLVGCMLLLSGIVGLIGSLTIHNTDPFFSALLLSLLSIVAGAFLLFNPHAGEISLTLVIAIIFIFQAAFETLFAIAVRPSSGWIPMLSSAIVSMAVALTTSIEPPFISVFMIGLLIAGNFATTGLAYISIWRALKAPAGMAATTVAR